MQDLLRDLLDVAVVVFAVSSMLLVGMTYSVREILGPLRRVRMVALALLANFVLVPAWGLLLTRMIDLDEPFEVGLLLVAAAAGAPFLVKLVVSADGDLAFASSLLVLLLPVTVLYMPLVVPLIAPEADVSTAAIAMPLFLTNLLPILVGMVVLSALPMVAVRVRPVLGPLSTAALVALLAFTLAANWDAFAEVIGEGVILASLLLIAGAFLIGFVLGTPDQHRDEVGLATAQRNIAAATVVATQALGDPDVVVTVVVTSTVSMALLFPLTRQLRKWFGQSALAARGEEAA